MTGLLLNHY